MKTAKAAPWVIGTVLVSAVILALAWMLAISPQLAAAATARTDTEAAEAQNQVQRQRLALLEKQFAELDTYKAELAELRTQVPEADELPTLFRQIAAASTASTAFVVSTDIGMPEVFLGASSTAAADAVAPAPASDGTDATDTAATATTPTPTGVEGLYAIPVDITVLGSFPATLDFVNRLQTETERLFVVTQFTITGQDQAEASGGKPATQEGDAEFLVQGYVYVLSDAAPTATVDPNAPGTAAPSTTTDN